MQQIVGFLKATYNFFSGDAILLSAGVIAFAAGWALTHLAGGVPLTVVAVVFVAVITAGLVITLNREIAGRARQR